MTFEEKLKRLSEIAEILESKGTGLDEGLKSYEDACKLIDECIGILDDRTARFERVTKRLEELNKQEGQNR